MSIEALEPRRMMAATALDPTFADGGRFRIAKRFDDAEALITAGRGAYFVEVRRSGTYYAVKLNDKGVPDPTFGVNGYAYLPASKRGYITKLAYDARRDLLYVAGYQTTDEYDRVMQLTVSRLNPDGSIDLSYGDKGKFIYSPPPSVDLENDSVEAGVKAINVLRDGSVVLAVERIYHHFDTASTSELPDTTQYGLCLIKLRRNGTRDVTYGKRGVANLLEGYALDPLGYYNGDARIDRGFFGEVRTDADGVTHVLMRRDSGTRFKEVDLDTPDDVLSGRFEIEARTVSPGGVVDPATTQSWKLFDSTGDGHEYTMPYVGFDGGVIKVVVGARTPLVYTLRPGLRPKSRPLRVDGFAQNFDFFVRSGAGTYYAADKFGDYTSSRVVRLKPDFTPDRTFGQNGVAMPGVLVDGLFADDAGRLLMTDDSYQSVVERLA